MQPPKPNQQLSEETRRLVMDTFSLGQSLMRVSTMLREIDDPRAIIAHAELATAAMLYQRIGERVAAQAGVESTLRTLASSPQNQADPK